MKPRIKAMQDLRLKKKRMINMENNFLEIPITERITVLLTCLLIIAYDLQFNEEIRMYWGECEP